MLEPDLIAFVRDRIRSIWTLELLLLLQRNAERAISPADLVRDLRASSRLIDRSLAQLAAANLIQLDDAGAARFAPATPELRDLCDALSSASLERPIALRDAIVLGSNQALRNFADAFRFKGKDE